MQVLIATVLSFLSMAAWNVDERYDGLVSLFPQMRLVAIPCYVPKTIATLTLINLTICSSNISHISLMARF